VSRSWHAFPSRRRWRGRRLSQDAWQSRGVSGCASSVHRSEVFHLHGSTEPSRDPSGVAQYRQDAGRVLPGAHRSRPRRACYTDIFLLAQQGSWHGTVQGRGCSVDRLWSSSRPYSPPMAACRKIKRFHPLLCIQYTICTVRRLLCRCNGLARHPLKHFLIYGRRDFNPRPLTGDWRQLDHIAKGCMYRFTYPAKSNITHDDGTLVLKRTHGVLLLWGSRPLTGRHDQILAQSARSRMPISRTELAMTGREESSCRSAPVTGRRMPGIASPTAMASTESEEIRFCLIARMAWRERLSRW